ncbi:acetylajmalan esterase-like [Rhodamnia argentea]|uniref:Acetylajmalan esterase-like n=1 Tax=Rhodamnia argentea TaxID=178133 RepID=A0A8B8QJ46_9MYRT|nr:acetylajmalan esterase-like [Rhodamnia argentea]
MASPRALLSALLGVICSALVVRPPCEAQQLRSCEFDAIYQLGDSTSDTGNLIHEGPIGAASPCGHPPYGQDFPGRQATGRCSNGLLMIDYLSLAAGVPSPDYYLNRSAAFTRGHGVNFAFAGATALAPHVLAQMNISSPATNSSLGTQLDWMFSYFNSICFDRADCVRKLEHALFMVGEIGGSDYYYALFQGKSIEEVKNLVPQVVMAIKDAVQRVIGYGASRVVVPGNFPIGCFPIYLARFETNHPSAYDRSHCLKDLNDLVEYHNGLLRVVIGELGRENQDVVILYGDYYNAFASMYHSGPYFGFDMWRAQKACCGSGGDYNFNPNWRCGTPGVVVCPDTGKAVSWDGIHMTQRANFVMTNWLVHDLWPKLKCNASLIGN